MGRVPGCIPGLACPLVGLWLDVESAGQGSGHPPLSLLKSGAALGAEWVSVQGERRIQRLGNGLGGDSVSSVADWRLCVMSQGGAGRPMASFGLQLQEQTRSPRKTALRVCV